MVVGRSSFSCELACDENLFNEIQEGAQHLLVVAGVNIRGGGGMGALVLVWIVDRHRKVAFC